MQLDMKLITSLRPSFFSSSSSSQSSSKKKDKRKMKSTARSVSRAEFASFTSSGTGSSSCSDSDLSAGRAQSTPQSVLRCSAERITCKELELVLRRLGPQPPTEVEVTAMLTEAADRIGRDNSFRMEEILALCGGGSFHGEAALEPPPPADELKETFAVFDVDGDGRISAEELHALLGQEGWCTLEDCRRMIGGVDTDGDGYVCFEEFVRMMT